MNGLKRLLTAFIAIMVLGVFSFTNVFAENANIEKIITDFNTDADAIIAKFISDTEKIPIQINDNTFADVVVKINGEDKMLLQVANIVKDEKNPNYYCAIVPIDESNIEEILDAVKIAQPDILASIVNKNGKQIDVSVNTELNSDTHSSYSVKLNNAFGEAKAKLQTKQLQCLNSITTQNGTKEDENRVNTIYNTALESLQSQNDKVSKELTVAHDNFLNNNTPNANQNNADTTQDTLDSFFANHNKLVFVVVIGVVLVFFIIFFVIWKKKMPR